VKAGDIVRIKAPLHYGKTRPYQDFGVGAMGMIIALAKRLYIPAAKVMVLSEVAEFDLDELELM
jgi:hypothetical protein